jgi:hypothetical protein
VVSLRRARSLRPTHQDILHHAIVSDFEAVLGGTKTNGGASRDDLDDAEMIHIYTVHINTHIKQRS